MALFLKRFIVGHVRLELVELLSSIHFFKRCGYGTRVRNQKVWEVVCRVLKHTSLMNKLSVYELQERLAEPERQEQQRMVDLEVFNSLPAAVAPVGQSMRRCWTVY